MTYDELIRALRSSRDFQEIDKLKNDIANVISKIKIMFGYDQQNSAHQYDLWEHCVRTMLCLPKDITDIQ